MFTWLILAVGAVGVVVAKDAALAQSSSGSSRSTWDIILACLATIIACTWTVQHSNVPTRNASDFLITVKRITRWLVTLMAPEIATFLAVDELKMAVNIVAACNSAEAANSNPDKQTNIAAIRPIQRSVGLTVDLHEVKLHPVQDKWSVAQAYCVLMGGLALQTEDGWIYTVSPSNISNFIQAGIISCRNFRDRDIKDKAKADSFAKTFTLLQSTWSVINILARVIYGLPVSLVELTTVSYVACAVFTYAFWWHKPKDMMTPIIMYLPYSRSTLPPQVQTLTDSTSTGWTHLRVVAKEESLFALPNIYHDWRRHAIDEPARKPEHAQGNSSPTHMTTRAEALVDAVGVFIALLFCGIHIAAYVISSHLIQFSSHHFIPISAR